MKNIIKLIFPIFLLGFTNSSYSQDFWEQLYFPDSINIMCITTNNQGHIFAGVSNDGNSGGLYRSTDNAQAWELVLDAGNFMVQSIAINENGYIYVGKTGFGIFMVSSDNGDTWEEIELPINSNIMKILCVGQDTIFVSIWADNGAFLTRSFDSGETWESCFITDHPNEYVSDIAISNTGDIYVSVSAFFMDMGGVYKSEDGGATLEYIGLLNHQVMTIEINSNDDVFTGDWWVMNYETPGIHTLYEGAGGFELIFDAYHATDIVINSENHIYATANEGVVRSFDNGQTFEYIDDDLSSNMKILHIGYEGFLYAARYNRLVKSINPIVTGIDENKRINLFANIRLFPNPVVDVLYVNIVSNSNNRYARKVRIYNLFGELILRNETTISGDYFRLDVSNLAVGFYLIEILNDNKIFTSNFIKN